MSNIYSAVEAFCSLISRNYALSRSFALAFLLGDVDLG